MVVWLFVVHLGCNDKDAVSDTDTLSQHLNLPENPYNYSGIQIPSFLDASLLAQQDNTPANNMVSDWGATLGRVLFYDKLLSINNTTACASCHQQENAFSDADRFSSGFEGGLTNRHSMGLLNAKFRPSGLFFWDGRAPSLEEQVLQPIQDSLEMGLSLDELIHRIESQEYYEVLFRLAYGDKGITKTRIANALAQFLRSIQSFESRYDLGRSEYNRSDSFQNFTQEENLGKSLFFDLSRGNCGGCHYTDAFVMDVPRNNGIDVWESTTDKDLGYEATTGNVNDRGKFIAPSLRNIASRPPYMHDGRFSSLREVIDHYSDGIQWSSSLDDHLKAANPNAPVRFNLSDTEKNALVAFLNTLTDESILVDQRFSDPFIQ